MEARFTREATLDADSFMRHALEAMVLTGAEVLTPQGRGLMRNLEKRLEGLMMTANTQLMVAHSYERAGKKQRAKEAREAVDRLLGAMPRFQSFWATFILRGFSRW